ncbi:oleosin 5-like [Bidens hawaiensis]|uniref:oleosin 5-like n=1 Tax=Bidens hawaiensis TaxID=980011 RepID=UPI004049C7CF
MSNQYDQSTMQRYHQQQISMKTMIIATVVGVTIGGPLLFLMSLFFIATMTLLVGTSPLLVIFSPLLLGAGFVTVAALAGFGAAGVLAMLGLSALGWVVRLVRTGQLLQGVKSASNKLVETGENVKESVKNNGKELVDHLKQTATEENSKTNVTTSRG